jgi:hypothetical protein
VLLVLQGALSVILLIGAGRCSQPGNVWNVRWGYDVDPAAMAGSTCAA